MRRAWTCIAAAVLLSTCTGPESDTPTTPDGAFGKGGPAIKSIQVSPSSASTQVGQTVQLTAATRPATTGTVFAWSSSSSAVATVNSSGLVTAVGAGTATIRATAAGKTGSATITVTAVQPPPPPPPPPPPGSVTFVGTGDIADCTSSGDEATANLLDGITGSVFTLGDNVYPNGTLTEYNTCYNPSWGRHKARTYPSPGNHEYNTPGGAGYYAYFGAAAGDPATGYYSFELGAWHVIVLNSNIARDVNSAQVQWLRADLTANTRACTIAYWHHPRFSSGFEHGNDTSVQTFWDLLYEFNADVIMGGHDHDYERFAPQTPGAIADNARGIREFVVGTGGKSLYDKGTLRANSQVFYNGTAGVLKLTLYEGGYNWQFVPVSGPFSDTGSGSCH